MRRISFALTRDSFLDGSKTVTRRKGWKNLKPGTRLLAVSQCMGLKPGESADVYGPIEVIRVTREPLGSIDRFDVIATSGKRINLDCLNEGFPDMTAAEFVDYFCEHMGGAADQEVTRIKFRRVEPRALDGVKLSAAMMAMLTEAEAAGREGCRLNLGTTLRTLDALRSRELIHYLGAGFFGSVYGLTDLGRQVATELREGGQ